MNQHAVCRSIALGVLTVVVFAGGTTSATMAQMTQSESSPSEDIAAKLDLGFDEEIPGAEVFVAVSLDVPSGVSVGTVMTETSFPNSQLSFLEVRRGLSAEAAGADVSAVVEEDPNDPANSILRLTVTTQGRRSLPSGVVADIAFKISEETAVGTMILLENHPTALTAEDPPQPTAVTGTDGSIQVSETSPVFVCFFYMH